MDYNKLLSNIFFSKNLGRFNKKLYGQLINNPDKYQNIINYINNIYNDSLSLKESLIRNYYNIQIHPKCPICGNPVIFNGIKSRMFLKACSNECSKKVNVLHGKNTCLNKYGDENYKNLSKAKQTKLERYGDENYNNQQKLKETFLKKYGCKSPLQLEKCRNKCNSKESKLKQYITKKKNKSFNKSELEDETYFILKEKYPDVIRQYRSNVYPFNCDFYVPSLNLYIECNYHWTHGCKIYEGTEEDINKVNLWKSKNTDYYNEAIKTWTIRDINKVQVAKENNLNYLIFYNIDELKQWIINQ